MNNTKRFWNKIKITNNSLLLIVQLLTISTCFSQWKTAEANNIKNDILIIYDVIYERNLTAEEQNSTDFITEITVTFNKDKMIERQLKNKSQIQSFKLYDYNKRKVYSNSILSTFKKSIEYDFTEPKISVEAFPNIEDKKICDLACEKGFVIINGKPKEIMYTNKLGLRYCKEFKIDGFLLQYPGYSKQFGHFMVVAKSIYYEKLPENFYSLEGFEIQTLDEYKKSKNESEERYKALREKNIGNKASFLKDYTIYSKKIDTKKMLGDVVVLNFWFTTCAPCKAEIPKLNELKEKYKDQKVHFIAIALDTNDKIDDFFKRLKLNYDVIAEGRTIASDFNVTSYPTNIVIDKKGIIQLFEVGYKSDIISRMSKVIDNANAE
ncbi:TlpA disulfide reductase family protein [Flavobacterium sp. NG2]|uniref:TlpA disulfide reductase family protein n=1 Tax=Flavobacterium sp. NG2 TaxID=3097547 RepID=UPI002A8134AF|nr:TlpA disulfide reductase family protein [Flavobacterium sp. NG2]WPR72431.1 TlpA disulfide reductase family protein [Flavobacterium sp. NG2]